MDQAAFDNVIRELKNTLDKEGNHLDVSSVIASDGVNYFSYYFKDKEAVDIRSIGKPIACMAIGAAIEAGLSFDGTMVGLETPVWPFLSKYAAVRDRKNREKWGRVTLLDCFRITLGHDKGLMFSADVREHDENELVDYVVNYPITREIGKDFVYSNAGTFIVSTLVTEYLGKNLDELVDDYLFTPMGITDFSWKKYGKYCAGCTGLKIQNEDLHRIGRLFLDDGVYNGMQLVPSHWIRNMRTKQVPSPTHRYVAGRAFPKWSYGLNLWICQDGNYYCDGTDAQYMIIIPKKNLVITTLGCQPDTEPVSNCLGAWK